MVDAIRGTFTAAGLPTGLEAHLTGQLAIAVDTVKSSGSSQNQTQELSLLFIVVLLLLAFRAVLAPIVTLVPAAFVLVLSGPVIAEATKIGVQVSSITQSLLIVLIPGGRDGLRGLPRVPRPRGAAPRAQPAGGSDPIREPGGGVHHVLGPDRDRGAGQPGPGRVRVLPEPWAGARDRDRADAGGRSDPAACAARDLRPGGLLADRRIRADARAYRPVGPDRRRRDPKAGHHAGRRSRAVRRPGHDLADHRGGRFRRRDLEPRRHRLGRRIGARRSALPFLGHEAKRRPPAVPEVGLGRPVRPRPRPGRTGRPAGVQRPRRPAQSQRHPARDRRS